MNAKLYGMKIIQLNKKPPILNFHTLHPGRGGLMIFSQGGMPLYGLLYIDPFGIFVPNGGLQNTTLRAVLAKSSFHFEKLFLKLWIFSPN